MNRAHSLQNHRKCNRNTQRNYKTCLAFPYSIISKNAIYTIFPDETQQYYKKVKGKECQVK